MLFVISWFGGFVLIVAGGLELWLLFLSVLSCSYLLIVLLILWCEIGDYVCLFWY